MRTVIARPAAAAIVILFAAFAPQQVQQHGNNNDPWERLSIPPKHYRHTRVEAQGPNTPNQPFIATIPLPPNVASVFVVTDIIVSDSLNTPGNLIHWTIQQTGGLNLVVARLASHFSFKHGIVFHTSNPNPVQVTALPQLGGSISGERLGITLAGYTM